MPDEIADSVETIADEARRLITTLEAYATQIEANESLIPLSQPTTS